jgi:hypothetical protein
VDDDFSLVRHDVPFPSWVGPEEMTDRVNISTTLRRVPHMPPLRVGVLNLIMAYFPSSKG